MKGDFSSLPIETREFEGITFYGKGNFSLLERPKVAILGSRRPLKYSRLYTYQLARLLSRKFVIVSGGAIGIDREAHLGAFPNTILVSPASPDLIYPKANRKLIEDIAREGVLLSLYPPTFHPRRYTFLERNRAIIQLSQWVIIPEGELKSGSANSYRLAKELGKEVWTLPHRLGESPLSHQIAREGGRVIHSLEEIGEELGLTGADSQREESSTSQPLSPEEEALKELFGETTRKFGKLI
ncbi:MAG: DNA-processing protein DprA [Epsilonproteobacteria bacterium]|jgi:DNA processing protein|nr:DNA-processing protein DprA [Campylobacterota bacterium]NPA89119.1 DNA-processing protein DprA [Campylobacterota bacterium]